MHREYHRWYNPSLGRDMELLLFGPGGARVLAFPTSMGRFFEWEDHGMVDALWHPEMLLERDAGTRRLFAAFMEAAAKCRGQSANSATIASGGAPVIRSTGYAADGRARLNRTQPARGGRRTERPSSADAHLLLKEPDVGDDLGDLLPPYPREWLHVAVVPVVGANSALNRDEKSEIAMVRGLVYDVNEGRALRRAEAELAVADGAVGVEGRLPSLEALRDRGLPQHGRVIGFADGGVRVTGTTAGEDTRGHTSVEQQPHACGERRAWGGSRSGAGAPQPGARGAPANRAAPPHGATAASRG
jgi:hypothetical protein